MNRNLYLFSGSHGIYNAERSLKDALLRYLPKQCEFLKLIALRKKVTHYFSDGCPASEADSGNEILDELVDSSSAIVRRILNKPIIDNKPITHNIEDLVLYEHLLRLHLLYQLRKKGIPIRFYETEREDYRNRVKLIQEAMKTNQWLAEIVSSVIGELKKDVDYKFIPGLNDICCNIRDATIFENVKRLAGQNSILFMGYNHKLHDFMYQDHDFNIYRVYMRYGSPNIKGNLPEDLRPDINKLAQKLKGWNFDIDFED